MAARLAKPMVELTAWLGVTWYSDDELPKNGASTGIRFVEMAVWPTRSMRLWFQYDNGLTLDNVVLATGNSSVPAAYLGGFINYEGNQTSRLEVGWRLVPDDVGQMLFRSEHVVGLADGYSLKGGLWLGPRTDKRTEWIAHTGIGIPVGARLRLDPTFFYARNGMPNEHEWRILLSGEYRFENNVVMSGGLAGGQASTGYVGDFKGIWDGYLKVVAPAGKFRWLNFLLRNESVAGIDGITVFSVGATFGIAER